MMLPVVRLVKNTGPEPEEPHSADRSGSFIGDCYRIQAPHFQNAFSQEWIGCDVTQSGRPVVAVFLQEKCTSDRHEYLSALLASLKQRMGNFESDEISPIENIIHTADGTYVLIRKYIHGTTLTEELADGRFDSERIELIIRKLTNILRMAHAAGVYHGCFSSDTVILRRAGLSSEAPCVIGFGVFTALHEIEQHRKAAAAPRHGAVRHDSREDIAESADILGLIEITRTLISCPADESVARLRIRLEPVLDNAERCARVNDPKGMDSLAAAILDVLDTLQDERQSVRAAVPEPSWQELSVYQHTSTIDQAMFKLELSRRQILRECGQMRLATEQLDALFGEDNIPLGIAGIPSEDLFEDRTSAGARVHLTVTGPWNCRKLLLRLFLGEAYIPIYGEHESRYRTEYTFGYRPRVRVSYKDNPSGQRTLTLAAFRASLDEFGRLAEHETVSSVRVYLPSPALQNTLAICELPSTAPGVDDSSADSVLQARCFGVAVEWRRKGPFFRPVNPDILSRCCAALPADGSPALASALFAQPYLWAGVRIPEAQSAESIGHDTVVKVFLATVRNIESQYGCHFLVAYRKALAKWCDRVDERVQTCRQAVPRQAIPQTVNADDRLPSTFAADKSRIVFISGTFMRGIGQTLERVFRRKASYGHNRRKAKCRAIDDRPKNMPTISQHERILDQFIDLRKEFEQSLIEHLSDFSSYLLRTETNKKAVKMNMPSPFDENTSAQQS